jgi:hypothetical protein
LLSEDFASLHCFDVIQHTEDASPVGLAFRPIKGRRVPEIAGALWLDKASAELRFLEFRFVQLPWDVSSDQLRGSVEFLRIGRGAWAVGRWWIRMPILEMVRRQARWELVIVRLKEEGAVVREAGSHPSRTRPR